MAIFYGHFHKALRASATGPVVDGRLQGQTTITVAVLGNLADTQTAQPAYELFGPGDVQRLAAGAIIRRFPAPGTSDAEETKLPLIEFAAADLPWRYSPEAGPRPRPWLVLVVAPPGPDGIVVRPDGRVILSVAAQQGHPLAESSRWAHRHDVDGRVIARVLSRNNLAPDTDYLACVVPAFTAAGADMWTGAAPLTVDCYDRWSFRTGPQGDFPELASLLHKADIVAINQRGKPFGVAEVAYRTRTSGTPATTKLPALGALCLPDATATATPAAIAAETAALTDRVVIPDGRSVITAPRYDAPFTATGGPAPATGWAGRLRSDPRSRGVAGLGAWTAIAWQDRISAAAATLAADLAVAQDRIRHVALGVQVSRSLWRRRVPPQAPAGADPAQILAAAAHRLAVLSPVLGRLPADTGGTALDAIAGRTPQLGRALLSSAARRAYRPGPARTAYAQPDAARYATVLAAANACPKPVDDPADIQPRDVDPDQVAEAIKTAIAAAAGDDDLAARILDRLGGQPSPGLLAAAFAAVATGSDGRPDPAAVEAFFADRDSAEPDLNPAAWGDWLDAECPAERCEPIDLPAVADAVAAGVDPYADPPPAARRVLATLPGITGIGSLEIEPEIDLPLWSFLSEKAPDWMLPGVGDLAEHTVVGLATNPAFVQALLTGANHQATAELRWRNIPLTAHCSPLRTFWQRHGGDYDIAPIRGWPSSADLGDPAIAYAGKGAQAVVVFRTPLFRRYPATVVYLYPKTGDWQAPDATQPLQEAQRKNPVFTGSIGPDVTFFGFDVTPADLADLWVVLEEPPAGYRFYSTSHDTKNDTIPEGWAYNRFALPVRVLIGPLL